MEEMKNGTNLKSFEIIRLFNKKNFFIEFDDIVKILISENGAGKTTILNIIVNFLRGNLRILRNLPFKELKVVLKNEEYYVMNKEKFFENTFLEERTIRLIKRVSFDYDLESESLGRIINIYKNTFDIELVLIELKKIGIPKIMVSRIRRLYEDYSGEAYIKDDTKKERKKYREFLKKINFNIEYFPTYRRIEKKFETIDRINYDSEINFGMSDVEKLIENLIDKIKSDTAVLFSKINKEIIYELIADDEDMIFSNAQNIINNPNIYVILNRVKYLNDSRDLMELINKKLKDEGLKGRFLGYYLLKINNIYEKQEKNESKIKKFIEVCNSYLFNKKFIYLDKETRVKVVDEEEKEINLSDLSSGEKQIVSLFSKLYLEDKNDLMIVIDEPELSISIVWQRKILVDIINSGKCKLLLTVTHSPFVFDNEFNDYAHSLNEYLISSKKGEL